MTSPIGIAWRGADEADLIEGGFGPLTLGEYPNSLTTAEESLSNLFGDEEPDPDDMLPARIHAARDDDGSIDIFGDRPSLWERLTSRWLRFKAYLTGPVPGDGGASVSGAYSPWGCM